MRFAFKTANQDTSWDDVLAVWQEADDIEVFESGWNFDHFDPIQGDSSGPCLEGWMMLGALAQATRLLRMGTLVTGIHYRHPAVLANVVSTLDLISGGRLDWASAPTGTRRSAARTESSWAPPRAQRPLRRGLRGAGRAAVGRDNGFPRDVVLAYCRSQRAHGSAAPAPADLHRRDGREAHVAHRGALRSTLELRRGTARRVARLRDVLHGHCDDVNATVDAIGGFVEHVLDLAIVYLCPPLTPAVLTPLAEALITL